MTDLKLKPGELGRARASFATGATDPKADRELLNWFKNTPLEQTSSWAMRYGAEAPERDTSITHLIDVRVKDAYLDDKTRRGHTAAFRQRMAAPGGNRSSTRS